MYKKIGGSSSPNRFGASMADLSDTMLHSTHSDFVLHEPPLEDLSNSDASAASSKPRVRSLDAFRGLVMVVMIFVDDTGSTYGGHWDHSPWDNITFADFVMPYFLFIVGVSSIYAHDSKNVPGNRCSLFFTTLWRCVKLFLIGLLLQGAQNFGSPYDLSVLRIPGILQRIAWAQIVVTLFEVVLPVRDIGFEDNSGLRYYRRFAWHWVACLTVLVGYALLMYTTSVPGCPIGSATPECNAAGYWDTKILGHQHMYGDPTYRRLPECSSCSPNECPRPDAPSWCNVPFDPEGIVASFAAVGSLFFGAFYGHILLDTKSNFQARVKQLLPYGVALVVLGLIMSFSGISMNKNLFSLSYICFMGGTATACLLLFDLLVDQYQIEKPFLPLIWMGMNPMVVFVMAASGVWEQLFLWVYYQDPNNNLITYIQSNIFIDKMGQNLGILMYTFMKITFWMIVTGVMAWKKIFVRV